jgi:hypothetical protein
VIDKSTYSTLRLIRYAGHILVANGEFIFAAYDAPADRIIRTDQLPFTVWEGQGDVLDTYRFADGPASMRPEFRRVREQRVGGPAKAPLREIEMRSGVYLARVESHVMVQPDGAVRSERTMNKGFPSEQIEVREGKLSSTQMEDLAASFTGWEDFDAHYSGVADDREISIRYGDKTVEGGSGLPRKVLDIRKKLMEIVNALPVKGAP